MKYPKYLQGKIALNDTFSFRLVLKMKNIGDNVDDLILLKLIYIK